MAEAGAVLRILYVDRPGRGQRAVVQALDSAENGFEITLAASFAEMQEHLRLGRHDLAVADLNIPGCRGLQLIDYLQAAHPGLPVVIITSDETRKLEVIRRGLFDCAGKSARQLRRLPYIVRAARWFAPSTRPGFLARCAASWWSPAITAWPGSGSSSTTRTRQSGPLQAQGITATTSGR